jgi:phage tail sheath gpL-like
MNFQEIPSALRYPGAYIEIDGSQAGLGGDIPAVLIVGQKLATGTAAAGEVTLVSSVQDAKAKAGPGSMLAQMVKRYRAIDPSLDVYMLPYADLPAGVAATSTLTVGAAPTAAGVLSIYIAGYLVTVGVTSGQAAASIATAIAAAINAAEDVPATAAAAAGVVTLTAKHKGNCGNGIDLRLNLYGEKTPAGLGLSLTGFAGGTGDPAPGAITMMIGQKWFRYVALGINDSATMAAR